MKYKVKMNGFKQQILTFGGFFIAGVVVLIIFVAIMNSTENKKKELDAEIEASRIESVCTEDEDGDETCRPNYYYEVDGYEYSCKSSSYSSNLSFKENDTIYYDSVNPSRCLSEYEYQANQNFKYFMFLPIIFIVVGLVPLIRLLIRRSKLMKLSNTGTLYRGLDYEMVGSNVSVNERQLLKIKVNFTLPSGETVELFGSPRYDGKTYDEDGKVDLLIDLDNPKLYYLDFSIEEK